MANKIRLNHGAGYISEENLDPVMSLKNLHNDLVFDDKSLIPATGNGPVYTKDGKEYFVTPNGLTPATVRSHRTAPISISSSDAALGRNPFNLHAGIRALPTLTGDVIKFIDPTSATNGTGSYTDPYNDFPSFANTVDNTIFCIKAGTELNRSAQYGSLKPGCSIIPYGMGNKPIIRCSDPAATATIYVDSTRTGVRLYFLQVEGMGTRAIGNLTSIANATNSDLHVVGCTVKMPGASRPSTDVNGIRLHGANNKIIGCHISDIPTDAIFCTGNDIEIVFNHISDVAKDGRNLGDCIQIDSGAGGSIKYNYLDRLLNEGKSTIVLDGNTSGITVEYNKCLMYSGGTFVGRNMVFAGDGNTVRRNLFIGGGDTIYIPANGLNSILESNVIVNNDPGTTNSGYAVGILGEGVRTIRNNLIMSASKTSKHGILHLSTSASTLRVLNNIFQGFAQAAIKYNAASGMTENYNIFHDNILNSVTASDVLLSLGANSQLFNPQLNSDYIPQNPLAHIMGLQYDSGNAATTGAQYDMYGTLFSKSIGAIQPNALDFDPIVGPLYWSINGI